MWAPSPWAISPLRPAARSGRRPPMQKGRVLMSDVTDVRVLVSGGTSGLGYAMSAELLAGGAQVVLTGRDPERTAAAAAQLAGSGRRRPLGVAMDVRDETVNRRAAWLRRGKRSADSTCW